MSALDLLKEFLASGQRNQWLEAPDLHVYVRKAFHVINGQGRHCLDIANAILQKPPSGAYAEFIFGLPAVLREVQAPGCPRVIYIENVQFPDLDKLFDRLGYTRAENNEPCPSFFKELL